MTSFERHSENKRLLFCIIVTVIIILLLALLLEINDTKFKTVNDYQLEIVQGTVTDVIEIGGYSSGIGIVDDSNYYEEHVELDTGKTIVMKVSLYDYKKVGTKVQLYTDGKHYNYDAEALARSYDMKGEIFISVVGGALLILLAFIWASNYSVMTGVAVLLAAVIIAVILK
jgi:hypothetical protein